MVRGGGIKFEAIYGGSAAMRRLFIVDNAFDQINQTAIFVRVNANSPAPGPIEQVLVQGNQVSCETQNEPKCGLAIAHATYTGSFYRTFRDIVINRNSVRGSRGHSIDVGTVYKDDFTGAGPTNSDGGLISVENLTITANTGDGRLLSEVLESQSYAAFLNVGAASNAVIANNVTRYAAASGIKVSGRNVVVANNTTEYPLQNAPLGEPSAGKQGCIAVYQIQGPNANELDTSRNVSIVGNSCRNTASASLAGSFETTGMFVSQNVAGIKIAGNLIVDDRLPSGTKHAITLEQAGTVPTEVDIVDNTFRGLSSTALSTGTIGPSSVQRIWNNALTTGQTKLESASTVRLPALEFGPFGDSSGSCVAYDSGADALFEDYDRSGTKNGTEQYIAATSTATAVNAQKLDADLDGKAEVAVSATSIAFDPDHDGTVESSIKSDGAVEFEGTPDSNQTLLTADDPTADRTIRLPDASGSVRLQAACADTASNSSVTIDGCDTVVITGTNTINNIITCNAAVRGRVLYVLCGATAAKLADTAGGTNLRLIASPFTCTADDVMTLLCDGSNWREVARAVN